MKLKPENVRHSDNNTIFDYREDGPKLLDFYKPHDRSSDMSEFPPSLTRQEFAEECDINTIMARYEKTGVISHVSNAQPRYVDFGAAPDFHSAMNMLVEAEAAFMSLPATVRRTFENDPVQFVEFAQNPDNLDQMRKWGLAPPASAESPSGAIARPSGEPEPGPAGSGDRPAAGAPGKAPAAPTQ